MFRLLATVVANGDAEAVDLAFQSVQLTCSDYMAAMPFVRLRRCLEVATLYSSQNADVNVSLTTISLLWNAVDLLGKAAEPRMRHKEDCSLAPAHDTDASCTEVELATGSLLPFPTASVLPSHAEVHEGASPRSKRTQLAASLSLPQIEELLRMVFLALHVCVASLGAFGWSVHVQPC